MTNGLLQLVAKGIEDKYIIGNPQITFFKSIYRRHTIFSQEYIPLQFSQQLDFGKKASCKITIEGDLIHDIWLVIKLPSIKISDNRNIKTQFSWIPKIGFYIIDYVEIEINGKIIDRHYGEWMAIWNELTGKDCNKLIGNIPQLTNFSSEKDEYTLYIPLHFWFCKTTENSLPIGSLQFSDININVSLNELNKCCKIIPTHYSIYNDILPTYTRYEQIVYENNNIIYYDYDPIKNRIYFNSVDNPTKNMYQYLTIKPKNIQIINSYLLVNYIFLDTSERELFAKVQHDYLIEQLWITDRTINNSNENIIINVKNPCKIILWKLENSELNNANILVNNRELFPVKDKKYFNIIQPFQHFKNKIPDNCYLYSFALQPDSHQPSGSLNTSKFETIKLSLNLTNNKTNCTIYCLSYNILRISNGLATLLFQ